MSTPPSPSLTFVMFFFCRPFYQTHRVFNQDVPLLTRAGSFCNLKAEAVFPSTEAFFACFDKSDNLYDWEYCMEKKVSLSSHQNISLIGGCCLLWGGKRMISIKYAFLN